MEKKFLAVVVNDVEVETTINSEYEQQAIDFLMNTDTTMKITRVGKRTDGGCVNKGSHHDYNITLTRNNKSWTFFFCDSVYNKQEKILPSAYDILACLQKYEVETDLIEFCNEFGYDLTSKKEIDKARRIHKAVLKEYENVMRLFEDVISELSEIN